MGCASSTGLVRGEAYSPSSEAKIRRNQIAPAQDADVRANRSVFPLGAGAEAAQRSLASSSSSSRKPPSTKQSSGSVVQSALKLQTATRTNQYKLVSSTPIGKGFQSKVRTDRVLQRAGRSARTQRLHSSTQPLRGPAARLDA